MPTATRSTRATSRASTSRGRTGNGPTRKANENGRKGNGPQKVGFHGLELLDGNNLIDLMVDGNDNEPHGIVGCTVCAAIVPDADRAKAAHVRWHEMIMAIDQRAG
jgi:hypothetical protein